MLYTKLWDILNPHDKTAILKGLKNKYKLDFIHIEVLVIDYRQNGMMINDRYPINFEELISVDFLKYEDKVNEIVNELNK